MVLGIGLCTVLYLWNSWNRDFWAPEEPDFAAVMKEMSARSDWLFPTVGGEMYAEKPPLLYWCALISSKILGADPRLAYRIPCALAAALALWVTYIAGRRFFDERIAAAACLIEASSSLFYVCASWLLTDMLFSSFCALSVVSFASVVLQEDRRPMRAATGWVALSLAALSKSLPLALALVLGPILLLILLRRGGPGIRREIERLRPLRGLAAILLLVGPWYAFMIHARGWEFLEIHFLEHNISRLVESESHKRPFWYYLTKTLWVDFLPWSVFIPLAAFFGKVQFRQPGVRLAAIWSFWTLLLLSFISSKQGKYLLPLWPALSLLAAAGLLSRERESLWEEFLGPKILRILPWVLKVPAALAATAGLYWLCGGSLDFLLRPFFPSNLPEMETALADRGLVLRFILIGALSGAAFYAAAVGIDRSLRKGRVPVAVAAFAGAALFAYLAASFAFDGLNRFKSARSLGEGVERLAEKGARLALYGRNRSAVHYYADRPVLHLDAVEHPDSLEEQRLDEYLRSGEKVYLLAEEGELKILLVNFPKYQSMIHEKARGLRLGSRHRAVLLTN